MDKIPAQNEPELSLEQLDQSLPVQLRRTMVTYSQVGIVKPNPKYALSGIISIYIPREPHNISSS